MIVEEILEDVSPIMEQRVIQDVVIRVAVRLDDDLCGLAAAMRDDVPNCCSLMMTRADRLDGSKASSLGKLVLSTDVLESFLGLATINACINRNVESNVVSLLDSLQIDQGDVVGMVDTSIP